VVVVSDGCQCGTARWCNRDDPCRPVVDDESVVGELGELVVVESDQELASLGGGDLSSRNTETSGCEFDTEIALRNRGVGIGEYRTDPPARLVGQL